MSLRWVKKALKYATKYHCTVGMLYLNDRKIVLTSMDEMKGYDGEISSCIDIITKLCEKYPPTKVAQKLHQNYAIEMSYVHRCIAIYLGKVGQMDDGYIKQYPESGLSSIGTAFTEYDSAVKNTMVLAKLVLETKKLPYYNLDSFSIVYRLNAPYELDLDEIFDRMDSQVDIALQYNPTCNTFASYNGNKETIRRKISTTIELDIPKRYVEFVPKTMDKSGVIMARWDGRDLKVYRDKFVFDCRGYDLENVASCVDDIISIIGLNRNLITFAHQSNTKASLTMEMDNWNAVILEDLIIKDKELSRIIRVANGVLDSDNIENVLHKNRSLVIYISYPPARCVFRCSEGLLKVSIASLSVDDVTVVVSVAIIRGLLRRYRKNFDAAYEKYSLNAKKNAKKSSKRRSRIDDLRSRLPELFANNYTRECHALPVMLDTEIEAEKYQKMGRLVIKYPLNGPYSRWFTSPSNDLYVGLKLNRLSNKETFKHIITCYTSNHYENPSRETYAYYSGKNIKGKSSAILRTLRILSTGRRGPLPTAMIMEYNLKGYSRIGTGGPFVDCVAYALKVKPENFLPLVKNRLKCGLLNVVRQEMCNKNDEELLDDINDIDNLDGIKYYRLLEEIYECNILLIEVGYRDKYTISIPQCKGKYIWEPRDGKYVIVVKNERKLYEDYLVAYELVVNSHDKCIFDKKDPLVQAIISYKMAHTIRSDISEEDVKAQYITEHGKCNLIAIGKKLKKCNSRPLYRPTIDIDIVRKCSTIFSHTINKRNWLSSTNKYLYFPDDASFHDWWNF